MLALTQSHYHSTYCFMWVPTHATGSPRLYEALLINPSYPLCWHSLHNIHHWIKRLMQFPELWLTISTTYIKDASIYRFIHYFSCGDMPYNLIFCNLSGIWRAFKYKLLSGWQTVCSLTDISIHFPDELLLAGLFPVTLH